MIESIPRREEQRYCSPISRTASKRSCKACAHHSSSSCRIVTARSREASAHRSIVSSHAGMSSGCEFLVIVNELAFVELTSIISWDIPISLEKPYSL
jgi:hypothetical protein